MCKSRLQEAVPQSYDIAIQTGFEFKKQRAIPVITGIVVATDQEETLMAVSATSMNLVGMPDLIPYVLQAYWESAAAAEERALTKKQGLALKRWQKLIQGIQIRRRMQHQYGDNESAGPVSVRLMMAKRMWSSDATSLFSLWIASSTRPSQLKPSRIPPRNRGWRHQRSHQSSLRSRRSL
jgi:hypothetical protein